MKFYHAFLSYRKTVGGNMGNYRGFEKYGRVLRDMSEIGGEVFREEGTTGWRLAEIVVMEKEVTSMSLHDNTEEVFLPLEGTAVLTVALDENFQKNESFVIEQPLLINKSVWHGLSAQSEKCRLLVIENADVHLEKKEVSI